MKIYALIVHVYAVSYFLVLIETRYFTSITTLVYTLSANRERSFGGRTYSLRSVYADILLSLVPVLLLTVFAEYVYLSVYAVVNALYVLFVIGQKAAWLSHVRTLKFEENKSPVRIVFSMRKYNLLFSQCSLKRYVPCMRLGFYICIVMFVIRVMMS